MVGRGKHEAAAEWFGRAVDQDDPDAMFALGMLIGGSDALEAQGEAGDDEFGRQHHSLNQCPACRRTPRRHQVDSLPA